MCQQLTYLIRIFTLLIFSLIFSFSIWRHKESFKRLKYAKLYENEQKDMKNSLVGTTGDYSNIIRSIWFWKSKSILQLKDLKAPMFPLKFSCYDFVAFFWKLRKWSKRRIGGWIWRIVVHVGYRHTCWLTSYT